MAARPRPNPTAAMHRSHPGPVQLIDGLLKVQEEKDPWLCWWKSMAKQLPLSCVLCHMLSTRQSPVVCFICLPALLRCLRLAIMNRHVSHLHAKGEENLAAEGRERTERLDGSFLLFG